MQQTNVSRERAINALKENNGDIVDAIMTLSINDDERNDIINDERNGLFD